MCCVQLDPWRLQIQVANGSNKIRISTRGLQTSWATAWNKGSFNKKSTRLHLVALYWCTKAQRQRLKKKVDPPSYLYPWVYWWMTCLYLSSKLTGRICFNRNLASEYNALGHRGRGRFNSFPRSTWAHGLKHFIGNTNAFISCWEESSVLRFHENYMQDMQENLH